MRLRDKYPLFAVLRLAAGSLFPALTLAFVLAGVVNSPPGAASTVLTDSSGMHREATLGEASLPARIAAPRAPDRPAPCFERHHPCGLSAAAAAHAGHLILALTQRASYGAPRSREPLAAPDAAPHVATSLSILFRNFRN